MARLKGSTSWEAALLGAGRSDSVRRLTAIFQVREKLQRCCPVTGAFWPN